MANTTQPIIVNLKGNGKDKDKKKRKYTKGLQSIQMSEVALTRGANRLADAVSEGIREYRESRDRSSHKKRNGMLVDYVTNVGKGVSKAVRGGSRIPYDLAQAVNHREFQNAIRFIAKTMNNFKYPSR